MRPASSPLPFTQTENVHIKYEVFMWGRETFICPTAHCILCCTLKLGHLLKRGFNRSDLYFFFPVATLAGGLNRTFVLPPHFLHSAPLLLLLFVGGTRGIGMAGAGSLGISIVITFPLRQGARVPDL